MGTYIRERRPHYDTFCVQGILYQSFLILGIPSSRHMHNQAVDVYGLGLLALA
jgi:hypothetical protein